jgi:hypothetical protein
MMNTYLCMPYDKKSSNEKEEIELIIYVSCQLCCFLSLFILLCVISCHIHHIYLYDTFTLVSTPQIERYRGNSMILIEYVQMACLGHF